MSDKSDNQKRSSADRTTPQDEPVLSANDLFLVEYEPPAEDSDLPSEVRGTAVPVGAGDPRAYQSGSGLPGTGTLIGGRFLLQQQFSGGSIGTIFRAVDERFAGANGTTANVAIKVFPLELTASETTVRVLQQAVAKGRALVHKNILRFIDIKRDGDLHFMVMEKLDGKSLATILENVGNRRIDLQLALDIVATVGRALEFAHEHGVIHTDVKPGNVIVTTAGDVKLFDIGIAGSRQLKPQTQTTDDLDEFDPQAPPYSSMQVLTGEQPVAADDVFSLGCLMYRLVAGKRVFGSSNAAEAAEKGLDPQRLDELNDTQWQALKKSLAYSRVPRFATCAEFTAALGVTPESQPEPDEADETGTVEVLATASPRRLWPLAAACVPLAAVAIFMMKTDFSGQSDMDKVEAPNEFESAQVGVDTEATVAAQPAGRDNGALATESVSASEESADTAAPEIDFAALLPATVTVGLVTADQYIQEVDLTLREGGEAATIDVVRMHNILDTLTVQLEEVETEGQDPVWDTAQYEFSNDGLLTFAAGQSRSRATISMPSNRLREKDREVEIRIRDVDDEQSELALLRVHLEDDDQREFEASLPQNTIAFAVDEISVLEVEQSVQIDVMRFQPDNEPAEVSYIVRDVTATAGEDYVPPGVTTVNFGRGQRTARIIIPLVQDLDVETIESFTLELIGNKPPTDPDIYQRIAVIIRDDDQ